MTKSDRFARDAAPLLAAACACAVATASLAASTPAPSLASSSAGRLVTTLSLNGAGPYYTLRLPIALASASARADLGDLRVRNATGETMPLAWVPQPTTLDLVQRAPVSLYKVPAAMSAASAVAAGATASVASTTSRDAAPSWIIDTRDAESDLVRLDLTLAVGAQGIFGLRIEASDDLQRWRLVQAQAQVVQLQQLPVVGGGSDLGGARNPADAKGAGHLLSTGIDLDGIPARYLRLTATSADAPPLVDATVTRTRRQAAPAPLEWSAPIAPVACEVNHCDYPLPRNLTVDALQIDLADADTVGQVVVLGRVEERYAPAQHAHLLRGSLHALHLKQDRAPPAPGDVFWDTLATENVYWLTQAASAPDLHSAPLRLAGQRWEMLRLSTAGDIGQLGHAPPTLRVGARPRTLVFLARGAGPFHLDRAGAADASTAMTMAQLMPTHAASDPLPADSATPELAAIATPASAAASAAASAPLAVSHAAWLWAALLAGLALMGGMAWTLLRKVRATPAARDGMDAIDL